MGQYDNRKLRYGAGPVIESKKPKNLRRAAARRLIEPGYPVDTPFQSREEVEAYFADKQIICLLCGRALLRLGIHLPRIHGMTEDQYRVKYGIPLGIGLVCAVTRERYVACAKATLDAHPDIAVKFRASQHLAAAAARAKPPPNYPEWLRKEFTARVHGPHAHGKRGRKRKYIYVKTFTLP